MPEDLRLTPSLRAMLERIERHSGSLLKLSIVAGCGQIPGQLAKLIGARYVKTMRSSDRPARQISGRGAGDSPNADGRPRIRNRRCADSAEQPRDFDEIRGDIMHNATWVYDDGGRKAAGYRALEVGDCVSRAITIATGLPYQVVYDGLNVAAKRERPRRGKRRSSARNGVHIPTIRRYRQDLGWVWHPTMQIGSGCTTHLRASELPKGHLIVSVSRHLTAVIDGIIHDTSDPSRGGTRCVYAYFSIGEARTAAKSAAVAISTSRG
jgi:hypothetical protein